MAELNLNSTKNLHGLSTKIGCALCDIRDLLEVMYELYGADVDLKVGALSTAALRILQDAQEACTEFEKSTTEQLAMEGGDA